jgi:threonyl-tRNA synthetase
MWLAPVQATVVAVADRHGEYAAEVGDQLRSHGLRVDVDVSDATVGEKIRKALTSKHPAVLVVGDADVENKTVGLRWWGGDDEERGVSLDDAVGRLIEAAQLPRSE